MKQLQNNYTTPEQSKLLLELGVPADSADLYYQDYGSIPMVVWTLTQPRDLRRGILKPCWSVGRLIEIALICHIGEAAHIDFDKTIYDISCISNIDWAIRVLESAIKCEHIDFSKLEE